MVTLQEIVQANDINSLVVQAKASCYVYGPLGKTRVSINRFRSVLSSKLIRHTNQAYFSCAT